jgi:Holliday junction resolvasome RuvABC endonuclease subunit
MSKVDQPWKMLWPLFLIVEQLFEKQKPDLVIIEKTSSFSGGFITGQVSNCMGVILACCGKFQLPVSFVYPSHVKKVLTGKGRATKTQMKKAVKEIMSDITDPNIKVEYDSEHAYDAVSNVLAFLIDEGFLEHGDNDGKG